MKSYFFFIVMHCLCFFISYSSSGMHFVNIPIYKCIPPRGEACVEIRKCPFFDDLLNRTIIPRPKYVIKLIRENQCGFSGSTPLVCCQTGTTDTPQEKYISTSTIAPTPIESDSNSNLVSAIKSHPNYPMLASDICGPIIGDTRITSGSKAKINEYPWMALIAYHVDGGVDFRCGGTVINERYVLTAAHCLFNSSVAGVRLGEYNLDTTKDCEEGSCASPTQDFHTEEIIIHPEYNPKTFENDIALIRLHFSANFSCENVQPICLPIQDVELSGKLVIVSGWGVTEEGFKSIELQKVSLPVLLISECQRVYNRFAPITSNQICAGGQDGKDSCGGDSGGPLTTTNKYNGISRFIQYGIVSYGPRRCGTDGVPGIYTKVSRYVLWILDNLKPWED